jgi:hypothetical protein
MAETHDNGEGGEVLSEESASLSSSALEDEPTEHGLGKPSLSRLCPASQRLERGKAETGRPGRATPSRRQQRREQVLAMLADPESAGWSDRAIAQSCGVDHHTVASLRKKRLSASADPIASRASEEADLGGPQHRRGRDGRLIDVSGLRARARAAGRPSARQPPPPQPPQGAHRPGTSAEVAKACVGWLCEALALPASFDAVDPSVGEGTWVAALRTHRPEALVSRFDTDPSAQGLGGSRRTGGAGGTRPGEVHLVADWLIWQPGRYTNRCSWDLCLGTRPARAPLRGWVEASLRRAGRVALLEPESVLGEQSLRRSCRPNWIVRLVSRGSVDEETSSWVLLVWEREGTERSRFDWLELEAAEDGTSFSPCRARGGEPVPPSLQDGANEPASKDPTDPSQP